MSKHSLAVVGIKVVGLLCLFLSLEKFVSVVTSSWFLLMGIPYEQSDSVLLLVAALLPFAVLATGAYVGLKKSEWLLTKLLGSEKSATETTGEPLNAFDLEAVAYSVIGMVIIVTTFPRLLAQTIILLKPNLTVYGTQPLFDEQWWSNNWPVFLGNAIETMFGVLLVFKNRSLTKFLLSLRKS